MVGLGFHKHSWLLLYHTPVPQAFSVSPISVLFLRLSSKPWAPTPADTCLKLGQAGRWHGQSVLVSLSCLPQTGLTVLLATSQHSPVKFLFCPNWSPHQWGGFPGCGNFSYFSAPSQGCRSHPASSFFFFPFILPSYLEIFLVFSGVWGLLLVFSRFSVRIIPHIDAFLMYLWEEESSTSYYCTILIGVPFFFFGHMHALWSFPSQGSDVIHSNGNANP